MMNNAFSLLSLFHTPHTGMLNILKDEYPLVPIVALTATARTKVAEDTINILQIKDSTRFSLGMIIENNNYS